MDYAQLTRQGINSLAHMLSRFKPTEVDVLNRYKLRF